MPESGETKIQIEQNHSQPGATARGEMRLDASSAPAMVRETSVSSTTLTSIRGIPEQASKNISAVVNAPELQGSPALAEAFQHLTSIYREDIKQLWLVARLDPKLDRGLELASLLKLFCTDATLHEHPELLSQLYNVATAESLFGLTRQQYQDQGMDFNKIRREFLVDIIRGAINSDNITQGKEPLCTIGSACKMLSKAEFIRLTTEYALNGSVTTASGDTMQMRSEYIGRAWHSSEATLGEVKCARRSAGMLMTFYGILQLGDDAGNPAVALVDRQQGLYWHQYTRAVEKLLNKQIACAHRTATDILIDPETGVAVPDGTSGTTKKVELFSYLTEQLTRGRSVFIDTKFSFSSSTAASDAEHGRHAMVAERFEMRGGERWVRCSNPIGDFVDTSKSGANHAEFFPPGTILGERLGFWFETAENGDILVRADVLQRNLQTALVQYNKPFDATSGSRPQFIGDIEASRAGPTYYFDFSEDIGPIQSEPVAVSISEVLDKLFTDKQAPTLRESQEEVQAVDRGSARRDVVKRRSLEEELLATQAVQLLQAEEVREEKRESEGENATGFSSPIATSQRSVVGHAFEYGRDGGRDVVTPQGEYAGSTNTQVAKASPSTTPPEEQATTKSVKPPTVPATSTTMIGVKALFG